MKSRSVKWCSILNATFCFGLGIHTISGQSNVSDVETNKQPWPTVSNLAASDRDWQTLTELKLSDPELNEVQRVMVPWMRRHCPRVSADEGKKRIASVSSERIRLHSTKPEQIAVSEIGDWEGDSSSCPCHPNLNCHTWVLNFSENRATTLLEYSGFGLIALKTTSHEFFDIVTASNKHSGQIELRTWRFDGEHYVPFRCATRRYSPAAINGKSPIDEIDRTDTLWEHPCKLNILK